MTLKISAINKKPNVRSVVSKTFFSFSGDDC